jgi:transposase
LAERNAVSLAFCWAHVRRRFYELAQSGPAPIATEALQRIAELYKIENEIRGRPAEERRAARQERSRPIIDALEAWLREKLTLVSQKSKLAEAIRYALARWAGLGRFLDDGRVEIDSTWWNARSGQSPSIGKTRSSPAPTAVASTGRQSPRS